MSIVKNPAELDSLVDRVRTGQQQYAAFSQAQVDNLFRAAGLAVSDARIPLANGMAMEESGMGIVEDKVIKHHFASEHIYNACKDEKRCGIFSENEAVGTLTMADPVGPICGIAPATNPISAAIFKSLSSLKTRNGIIFSSRPRAKNAINKAAEIVLRTAVGVGARNAVS
ncbi:hypothetical protein FJU30_10870 [Affinibrenneria salicis]|uniref:Uncharacterized protein n=1 Tax=Affinibrenneria salicis TaxID=2590031 RepID=A0A5J5G1U4_9GAMM|nr:hypothetical protein FJU30_10870 [Affinibrenneria salicis]